MPSCEIRPLVNSKVDIRIPFNFWTRKKRTKESKEKKDCKINRTVKVNMSFS